MSGNFFELLADGAVPADDKKIKPKKEIKPKPVQASTQPQKTETPKQDSTASRVGRPSRSEEGGSARGGSNARGGGRGGSNIGDTTSLGRSGPRRETRGPPQIHESDSEGSSYEHSRRGGRGGRTGPRTDRPPRDSNDETPERRERRFSRNQENQVDSSPLPDGEGFSSFQRSERRRRPRNDNEERPREERPRILETTATHPLSGVPEGKPMNRREHREHRPRVDQTTDEKGFVQTHHRAYDRHRPGTGRPINELKKRGAGKGNWGRPGSEVDEPNSNQNESTQIDEDSTPASEAAKIPASEEQGSNTENSTQSTEGSVQAPTGPVELTLEEYQKLQAEKAVKLELPPPRKPQEEDWSNYTALQKRSEEGVTSQPKKKSSSDVPNKKESKKRAVPLDQVIEVISTPPSGRSRRERPGERKERSANSQKPVQLNATNFPALSALKS